MKCIDVIEGTVKSILTKVQAVSIEDRLDDTEYVRMVKAIIDATDQFVGDNPELVDDPRLLNRVLYEFSRTLWLTNQQAEEKTPDDTSLTANSDSAEYQTYYYDYLYHRGNYPR